MHPPAEVLGAMITPAVLISAAALLLLSTAARLGRVNDRLQHVMAETERLHSQSDAFANRSEKHQMNLAQLAGLEERLLPLRSAVTGLYVTIGLLVVTSILTGVAVIFPRIPSILPVTVGMFGALVFLYSIGLLIIEAMIATRVTLHEISYVRALLKQSSDDPSANRE